MCSALIPFYDNLVKHYNLKLSLFVLPFISLIDQLCGDCLHETSISKEIFTDTDIIIKFSKKKVNEIICIAFKSFILLFCKSFNSMHSCGTSRSWKHFPKTYLQSRRHHYEASFLYSYTTKRKWNCHDDRHMLEKSKCGNIVS